MAAEQVGVGTGRWEDGHGAPDRPVLGWRLWRVDGERLRSWSVHHHWTPGANVAACRSADGPCGATPGRHCQCGFWALWSPLRCLENAQWHGEPPWHVMGLVAGWGVVARHGTEGFRAQHASVMCLFTDWAGSAPIPVPGDGVVARWTNWVRGGRLRRRFRPGGDANPDRMPALRAVAASYGIPLVSLQGALDLHVLGEWGVPTDRIHEVRAWVEAVNAG